MIKILRQRIADDYETFVKETGLDKVSVAVMATHSAGGREWDLVEGADPAFFAEPELNGGWYFLREEEVTRLKSVSATSGSAVEALKEGPGDWTVILTVPVEADGQPYQGCYYAAFESATGGKFFRYQRPTPPPSADEQTRRRVKKVIAAL